MLKKYQKTNYSLTPQTPILKTHEYLSLGFRFDVATYKQKKIITKTFVFDS